MLFLDFSIILNIYIIFYMLWDLTNKEIFHIILISFSTGDS